MSISSFIGGSTPKKYGWKYAVFSFVLMFLITMLISCIVLGIAFDSHAAQEELTNITYWNDGSWLVDKSYLADPNFTYDPDTDSLYIYFQATTTEVAVGYWVKGIFTDGEIQGSQCNGGGWNGSFVATCQVVGGVTATSNDVFTYVMVDDAYTDYIEHGTYPQTGHFAWIKGTYDFIDYAWAEITEPLDGDAVTSTVDISGSVHTVTSYPAFVKIIYGPHDYGGDFGFADSVTGSKFYFFSSADLGPDPYNTGFSTTLEIPEGSYDVYFEVYNLTGTYLTKSDPVSFQVIGAAMSGSDQAWAILKGAWNIASDCWPFNWVMQPSNYLLSYNAASSTDFTIDMTHGTSVNLYVSLHDFAVKFQPYAKKLSDYIISFVFLFITLGTILFITHL